MSLKKYAENLGLEEEDFRELTLLFIETTQKDLEKLDQSVKNNDFNMAREASHSIKGASGNLGFMDIWEAATKCEKASADEYSEIITENIEIIRSLTEKLSKLI
ncbi:MAG: Hpt domain-containing protein [Desulfobacteraceae bacterium]|jgi:HPt (histidine-containing phosphotransfer) domain-containing protein